MKSNEEVKDKISQIKKRIKTMENGNNSSALGYFAKSQKIAKMKYQLQALKWVLENKKNL